MFVVTSQDFVLAGVGLSLLGSVSRAVFHTPKQQAQINAIEAKADAILGQLSQGLQTGQAALRSSNRAAAGTADLTLALAPIIKAAAPTEGTPATPNPLTIAQGGV